ncbi:MAG: 4Fe-4S dicluster domain-containing protein [SAR202 cluster bacterium]|nr:4Fe-4S dicluster domain-containing protein [SAR202 cluster bacterium]
MYRCVHCGLCLSACPTYRTLGLETESPRGRIALMKAVQEGRTGITPQIVSHWEMCLQCRACEAVCPSGVPYGRMMSATRAQARAAGLQSDRVKGVSRLFLRGALPHPGRLRLGARLLRFYQRWGLQKLVRASKVLRLFPGGLAGLEAQLPPLSRRFFGPSKRPVGAGFKPALTTEGRHTLTVGLLSGCVMPLMQADTMRAAVRVLARNGCKVVVPPGQGCCGSLNLHGGDLEYARSMARRNIDAFLAAGVERIVTASAGCGSTMKEYHELLHNDPDYAEKASRFSQMTVDITEFLVSLPFAPPTGRLERRVTYQDPCHLAHAQRITTPPRAILKAIPGLQLVEMDHADRCCGGAGVYSMVQPELSAQILASKLDWIAATGAEVVATANPGCMMQLEQGLRRRGSAVRVCHVVDLLDEGYGGAA